MKNLSNESQYKDLNFEYGTITNAIYVESSNLADKGNEYIEALPIIPDQATIQRLNFKPLVNFANSDKKTEVQKLREIQQLEDIRYPMPYDYDLWTNIYLTMVQSYSKRTKLNGRTTNTIAFNDNEQQNNSFLVANSLAATVGFNMIGPSGCGKSSALEIALDYYPKVIRHTDENGNMTIQIPYIYVSCPPDSNFKVLYGKIGKEIDKSLGNTMPIVETEIMGKKSSKIGEILLRLEHVIEKYAIGIIILDEVQQLSFNSTKENSFNSLMTLVNDTMVGLGLVGTEEVISKIVQKQQFARRVGNRIACDTYTKREDYFIMLFNMISKYQWSDKLVEFSSDIKHEIYMQSHGIIAYLILFYTMIWSYYVTNDEKDEINLEYVQKLLDKYFVLIRNALNDETISEKQRDYYAKLALNNIKTDFKTEIENISQNNIMNQMIDNFKETDKEIARVTVLNYIKEAYENDFSDNKINEIFDSIYTRNKTIQELKKDTLKKLNSKSRKRRQMKSSSNKLIEDGLLLSVKESVGDPNNPI